MPDNDPLESLDNFPEGLHVDALPASEVRRRGDLMRRRNTALATVGGVVAAAVFIGTPVALLANNNDGKDDVQPAPSPSVSEDAQPGWLTEIPAEFPLADSFPEANGLDGSPTEVVDDPDIIPVELCGTSWPALEPVDAAGITYTGESEDHGSRVLLLLDDEEAATASLAQLLSAVQACPNQPTAGGDSILLSSLVDLDLDTEDSVVIAQQVQFDDGSISDLTITEVGRSGNAIWVETSYGSAAGPDVVEFETERLRERAAVPLGAMCVFSAEPCGGSESSTTDPSAVSTSVAIGPGDIDLAETIALDVDLEADVDGEKTGPSADVEGIDLTELCGSKTWPGSAAQRLAVRVTGPEYAKTRELVAYDNASDAVAVLAQLREDVDACVSVGEDADAESPNDRFYTTLTSDTGYDAVTFGQTYREGLGGAVYQFVRIGSAILGTAHAGEYSPQTIQGGADVLTEDNKSVTEQMCVFAEKGCA